MTSKTFKSEVSHGRLSISDTRNGLFTVAVRRGGESVDMIDLKTETAPALALAILEAAGFVGDENMFTGLAVANLRDHVEEQERITAESREQAELEAEALELVNAWMDSCGAGKYPSWEHVETGRREQGLAVARKAREIGAEK
ncbi:hypothetical protein ACTXOJ_11275 [Glutamicibacter arilaitensis]|uniref:hypothetical protein n=1 Tax=Glutamicibacter arilaitensis TaxID=256701 RepID=UPI003FD659FB